MSRSPNSYFYSNHTTVPIRDRPILTDIYERVDLFTPADGSVYILGTSVEDRSVHSQEWENKTSNVRFVRIFNETANAFSAQIDGHDRTISLRSNRQLQQFWSTINPTTVYLDITGLSHHVWAPLLRTGLSIAPHLLGVYVEPADYRFSATPTEGEIFDLSEKISGISPIPGFASLTEVAEQDVCFIPLLGFEGTRLAYIVEEVQPPGGKIVPVIGVPGFRVEYPFYSYHGNKSVLAETRAWRNVEFAAANCPFSLYYLLEDIAAKHPRDLLKIAPIGTKPHALGAVLYALTSRRRVEIVYDHPIRKAQRTLGTARLLVYHVSTFAHS